MALIAERNLLKTAFEEKYFAESVETMFIEEMELAGGLSVGRPRIRGDEHGRHGACVRREDRRGRLVDERSQRELGAVAGGGG
jgi:hypothetical protein